MRKFYSAENPKKKSKVALDSHNLGQAFCTHSDLMIFYFFSCNKIVPTNAAIRRLVKRVAVSNCVKRTFVDKCGDYMDTLPASRPLW